MGTRTSTTTGRCGATRRLRDGELASPSTLCRFERKSGSAEAAALHGVLFEQFVIGKLCFPQAHPVPPKRIVLDFDATDVTLH